MLNFNNWAVLVTVLCVVLSCNASASPIFEDESESNIGVVGGRSSPSKFGRRTSADGSTPSISDIASELLKSIHHDISDIQPQLTKAYNDLLAGIGLNTHEARRSETPSNKEKLVDGSEDATPVDKALNFLRGLLPGILPGV